MYETQVQPSLAQRTEHKGLSSGKRAKKLVVICRMPEHAKGNPKEEARKTRPIFAVLFFHAASPSVPALHDQPAIHGTRYVARPAAELDGELARERSERGKEMMALAQKMAQCPPGVGQKRRGGYF